MSGLADAKLDRSRPYTLVYAKVTVTPKMKAMTILSGLYLPWTFSASDVAIRKSGVNGMTSLTLGWGGGGAGL